MKKLAWWGLAAAIALGSAHAQQSVILSIGTGGTGGVWYPLGGAMANILTKTVPGMQVTAEVTGGSVDNITLIRTGKAELGFSMVDAAWDAYRGQGKFKEKVELRTLAVFYPQKNHVVTLEGNGIEKMADLRGKRVSVGSPGSGSEIIALRVLEAYGLGPKDLKSQDRLGAAESAGALKDRKLDAFVWDGGLPTAAVLDLGATPGIKIHLIPHGDAVPKMVAKYGALYFVGTIPKGTYGGVEADVPVATITNLLTVHERMGEPLAYQITKLLYERTPDLVAVHQAAKEITLKSGVAGSPIPFHPGALRYYKEKNIKLLGAQ